MDPTAPAQLIGPQGPGAELLPDKGQLETTQSLLPTVHTSGADDALLSDGRDVPGGGETSDTNVQRPRLSGAAKRRLRYLRKHGVGGEEARKLALLPVASQPTHYKRGHSSSGSTPDQRAAKRPRHQGSSGQTGSRLSSGHRPVSYSAAVGSVRLGIVNDDFPEVHWTDEQLNVVRMALARWIISNPADAHPLSFLGLVFRRGWLLLTCEDAATAAAVRAEVPRLRPWEGARLRVLAEADFPRTRFAAGYFPFSSQLSTEEIMSSVIGQNREEDLRTREWRVVQRPPPGPGCPGSLLLGGNWSHKWAPAAGGGGSRAGVAAEQTLARAGGRSSAVGPSRHCAGGGRSSTRSSGVGDGLSVAGPSRPTTGGRAPAESSGAGDCPGAVGSTRPSAAGGRPVTTLTGGSGPSAGGARLVRLQSPTRGTVNPAGVLSPPPWAARARGRAGCAPPPAHFVTRDLAAILIEERTSAGTMRAVFASAYFAGDVQEVPPEDVCRLVSYCVNNNLQFVIGCDANAHNVVWGSTDTNTRGEELLNYIYSNRLEILNRGNIPTFVTRARSEVLDITLSSRNVAGRVWGWHVTDEVLSSDHRLISFKISFGRGEISTFRVSKNTDWPTYQEILNTEIEGLDRACNTPAEADSLADDLMNGIIRAYEASCPLVSGARRGSVPWWSRELENLRIRTRKLFNRAKNGGDWDTYKRSLTAYNKALRKARRSSWRNFCGGLEDVSAASKLQKVLSREGPGHISLLERADGSFTTSTQETLEVLMKTHFPGSTVLPSGVSTPESDFSIPHRRELGRSRTIFTPERVKWAINSFKPFKSPGGDGVFPALLQRGLEVLSPLLIRLFCASYAMAYIPRAWRRVRVVFIPKAGGQPRSSAKGYRPISLMSFVLKTMEKILGHLLKEHFQLSPLNKAQHAYLKGRSTETALVEVTALIEKALEEKESAVGCFLDIGGAFDNTSYASIRNAAHKKGCQPSNHKMDHGYAE
ncbi:unnamed protein product [Nesidiocoris tenuis]|uniref:Reverse transcriptase domain-containing protein n=1 Tax=Nesidiocoris tenuis TaxID=355587 RepID=A0A6H5HNT4_9HEMI|nr:unnamed protein product [Nesidiocoris tenuis]